jgi:hypothetical protein
VQNDKLRVLVLQIDLEEDGDDYRVVFRRTLPMLEFE